jgi:hypothetical protein
VHWRLPLEKHVPVGNREASAGLEFAKAERDLLSNVLFS